MDQDLQTVPPQYPPQPQPSTGIPIAYPPQVAQYPQQPPSEATSVPVTTQFAGVSPPIPAANIPITNPATAPMSTSAVPPQNSAYYQQPINNIPAAPVQAIPSNTVVNSSNPSTADDVDVIEKEWVDAAKNIVQKTKSDPYQQEQEIEKLQIDYLKKRYGRELRPS
jgi:hypothetical protein